MGIIGKFKEFTERIIGKIKSIVDLSLYMYSVVLDGLYSYVASHVCKYKSLPLTEYLLYHKTFIFVRNFTFANRGRFLVLTLYLVCSTYHLCKLIFFLKYVCIATYVRM